MLCFVFSSLSLFLFCLVISRCSRLRTRCGNHEATIERSVLQGVCRRRQSNVEVRFFLAVVVFLFPLALAALQYSRKSVSHLLYVMFYFFFFSHEYQQVASRRRVISTMATFCVPPSSHSSCTYACNRSQCVFAKNDI